jgi:hypothetical protein
MNRKLLLPALLPAILVIGVAGCVTPREGRRWEFVGRPIHVQAASGQVSTLFLRPDGSVEARFGEQRTAGRWDFTNGNLCYTWGGSFRECWPHTAPFVPGRTETVRSDRGNVVRVTME